MNMSDNSSTMSQWLAKATLQLEEAGIGTARLDALVLLEDITGKDRTHLLAHPELELTTEQQNHLQKLLNRRVKHEPLAYIRAKTEFYKEEFIVSTATLEPRPESETMIDLLRKYFDDPDLHPVFYIADVGAGSGALGIIASLYFKLAAVDLLEISPAAVEIAKVNTKKLKSDAACYQSDMFSAVRDQKYDAILANLPYVPDNYQINEAALQEPHMAIFGGTDGLDAYRQLFDELPSQTHKGALVFTESLPFQHDELKNIALAHNFKQIDEEDFIQVFERQD
jgi:release factor glutamine methyltransferase